MNVLSKKKAIVLSLVLAAMALTTTNLNAQNDGSRGLFGKGAETESNNRDGGVGLGGATTENPTETPLGSGIALLVVAGAGYALLKRKEGEQ